MHLLNQYKFCSLSEKWAFSIVNKLNVLTFFILSTTGNVKKIVLLFSVYFYQNWNTNKRKKRRCGQKHFFFYRTQQVTNDTRKTSFAVVRAQTMNWTCHMQFFYYVSVVKKLLEQWRVRIQAILSITIHYSISFLE